MLKKWCSPSECRPVPTSKIHYPLSISHAQGMHIALSDGRLTRVVKRESMRFATYRDVSKHTRTRSICVAIKLDVEKTSVEAIHRKKVRNNVPLHVQT